MTIRDRPILYVDTVTNLISGIVRPQFSNRIQVSFVDAYLFADYRRVDNLLLPFYIERYINGVLQQILEIQSIQINPAIDSHIFDLR